MIDSRPITAPEIYPIGTIDFPRMEITTLENGATLHAYNGGDQDLLRIGIYFQGGSREVGVVEQSLCLATLTEGAVGIDGDDIADILDFNGARIATRCHSHYTGIELTVLNSRLSSVLPVMSKIVSRPSFPVQAIKIAATRAAAQLRLAREQVMTLAFEGFIALMAGKNHPAAFQPTEKDYLDCDRDTLVETWSKIATAKSCHVFVAGKINGNDMTLIKQFVLELPTSPSLDLSIKPYIAQKPQVLVTEHAGSLQNAIMAGMPAINRNSPDYANLRLSIMALGGYFGSRLMSNIREEKGLTYGISASLAASVDAAYISINAQCNCSYTEEVIRETAKEMNLLKTNPPTGDELSRLKAFAATQLLKSFESPVSIMSQYISQLVVGIPAGYFEEQQKAIDSLTGDIIAACASKYINTDELRISIGGEASSTLIHI